MQKNYFTSAEMACKHCGLSLMQPNFMAKLNLLRELFGQPIIINSAYRCPEYNKLVGTTGDNGPHTTGLAVDISVSGENALHLIGLAYQLGFTGIGVAQKGKGRFIHLDMCQAPEYPRPTIWSY